MAHRMNGLTMRSGTLLASRHFPVKTARPDNNIHRSTAHGGIIERNGACGKKNVRRRRRKGYGTWNIASTPPANFSVSESLGYCLASSASILAISASMLMIAA